MRQLHASFWAHLPHSSVTSSRCLGPSMNWWRLLCHPTMQHSQPVWLPSCCQACRAARSPPQASPPSAGRGPSPAPAGPAGRGRGARGQGRGVESSPRGRRALWSSPGGSVGSPLQQHRNAGCAPLACSSCKGSRRCVSAEFGRGAGSCEGSWPQAALCGAALGALWAGSRSRIATPGARRVVLTQQGCRRL